MTAGYIAKQLDGLASDGESFVRVKFCADSGAETFWMNVPVDRLPAIVAAVDMPDLGPINVRTIVNGQNVTVQATGEGFDISTATVNGSAFELMVYAACLESEAIDKLRRASRWRAVAAAMNQEKD